MRVSVETPELLVIERRPWLLAIVLGFGGLFFAGITIALFNSGDVGSGFLGLLGTALWAVGFAVFVRRTQLILDRRTGEMLLRRRTVLGYHQHWFDLGHLDRAEVETSFASDTDTHRMALVMTGGMDAGRHLFSPIYVSGNGTLRGAEAVNRWLGRSDPRHGKAGHGAE